MSLCKDIALSAWFLQWDTANEEILTLVLIRKRNREQWQQFLKSNTHMVSSTVTQPCMERYNCKPWQAFRPAFKAKRKVEHEANRETERAIRFEEGCREKTHKLQGSATTITFNFTSWVSESHYYHFRASKKEEWPISQEVFLEILFLHLTEYLSKCYLEPTSI